MAEGDGKYGDDCHVLHGVSEIDVQLEPGGFLSVLAIDDMRVPLQHHEASVSEEIHRHAVGDTRLSQKGRVGMSEHVRGQRVPERTACGTEDADQRGQPESPVGLERSQQLRMCPPSAHSLPEIALEDCRELRSHVGRAIPPAVSAFPRSNSERAFDNLHVRSGETEHLLTTKTGEHHEGEDAEISCSLELTSPLRVLEVSEDSLGLAAREVPRLREVLLRGRDEKEWIEEPLVPRDSSHEGRGSPPVRRDRVSRSALIAQPTDPSFKENLLDARVAAQEPIGCRRSSEVPA